MSNLVTPKQLVAIRAIANSQGRDAMSECLERMKCRPEELSRWAASRYIDFLKTPVQSEPTLQEQFDALMKRMTVLERHVTELEARMEDSERSVA